MRVLALLLLGGCMNLDVEAPLVADEVLLTDAGAAGEPAPDAGTDPEEPIQDPAPDAGVDPEEPVEEPGPDAGADPEEPVEEPDPEEPIEGPESHCGDSIVDEGEDCDDGNTIDGDGCDRTCNSMAADDRCRWIEGLPQPTVLCAPAPWAVAAEVCEAFGGSLATVHDDEHNDALTDAIAQRLPSVWFGIHGHRDERWHGEDSDFRAFRVDRNPRGAWCGQLHAQDGRWTRAQCQYPLAFVCSR